MEILNLEGGDFGVAEKMLRIGTTYILLLVIYMGKEMMILWVGLRLSEI